MTQIANVQNKVDISVCPGIHLPADIQQMSEQDQKAFKMYGKVPGKNLLSKMQKVSIPTYPHPLSNPSPTPSPTHTHPPTHTIPAPCAPCTLPLTRRNANTLTQATT